MKPFIYCPYCASELAQRQVEDETRLACPACSFVHYNNPTPVVAAVVEHPQGVVLVRKQNWPATWFGLVTGFLERGEAVTDGVLREVEEELGLRGQLGELIGVYEFTRMNEVIIAYHVQVDGPIQLSAELAEHKLVPVNKLKPWPFATGLAVADWLARRQPTAEQ